MKKLLIILIFTLCSSQVNLSYSQTIATKRGWVNSKPFVHTVFVENKGQFRKEDQAYVTQPILYYNRMGKTQMYFSASAITFRYDSVIKMDESDNKSEKEREKNLKALPEFLTITWQNSNPDVIIEVQEPAKDYFTFGNPEDSRGRSGILAHAWKKLIYHNIYNNIDIEYTFPEDKGGIEYSIRAYPGADISKIKMAYSGNAQVTLHGNEVNIISPCLNLIDHAVSAKDEGGNSVMTSFSVKNNTVSFNTQKYDKTKILTIDPWITSTNFFMYNLAYDIQNDNQGNVYIGGGEPPYELQQYDSTGTLKWTYNTISDFGGPPNWWGGFTTDVRSGSSYCLRGLGTGVNPWELGIKLSNTGGKIYSYLNWAYSGQSIEFWRVALDYQNNQLVIAAGENYQAATMDTGVVFAKYYSYADTTTGDQIAHDMSLLALDGNGNAYMGSNKTSFGSNGALFNNVIFKLRLPMLSTILDTVNDNYSFTEFLSMYYYPAQINGGFDYANGYNGMVANKTMLVTYDGFNLKKWNTANLALEDSYRVTWSAFQWGGLDLDCEGNIYTGNNNSVTVFDSNLNQISSIPLNNTVYALKVSNGRLYACGYGFVQEVNIGKCGGENAIQQLKTDSKELMVFPNPFTNSTTVSVNTNGKHYLELYDITGRRLQYIEFTGKSCQLSKISCQLAQGMYFIRVFDFDKQIIGTNKIVVQ